MWRMEDVLDLYEEPYDPKRPVVCFDEMPYQMVAEKRTPLPTKPGRPQRYDYEYERKGTANLFLRSSSPRIDGDTWTSPSDARRWTLPMPCGIWQTSTTPRPRRCGWCSTT